MVNPVAKMGEVVPTPGTQMLSPAVTGAWLPGAVVPTIQDRITITSVNVLKKAECTFTFVGADSNGVPVVGTEKVILEAGSTKLTGDGIGVLKNGDQRQESHGNKLEVVTVNVLRTG